MSFRRNAAAAVVVVALAFIVLAAAPAVAHGHEVVLLVGRTAAGQIKVDADLSHALAIPESVFPGIPGYAAADPAFHSTVLDDPGNDLFQPVGSANFQFVVTAADPGIGIYTPSGMLPLNMPVFLGPPVFDSHPIWHIPAGPLGANYNITLKVQDTTGTCTDSAPLTIPFTTVPEPSGVALLALGAIALRRTQRR
jgi:MYXO-CTERM domain-containing protein